MKMRTKFPLRGKYSNCKKKLSKNSNSKVLSYVKFISNASYFGQGHLIKRYIDDDTML